MMTVIGLCFVGLVLFEENCLIGLQKVPHEDDDVADLVAESEVRQCRVDLQLLYRLFEVSRVAVFASEDEGRSTTEYSLIFESLIHFVQDLTFFVLVLDYSELSRPMSEDESGLEDGDPVRVGLVDHAVDVKG